MRHQLLREWNDTRTPASPDSTLDQRIADRVRRTPDMPAVVDGDRQLDYGELDRRANRMAHRLRALGVGPEVPVGILLERSAEMVVAMLAVLKAGGIYLPLDPAYPRERLRYIAEDSATAVVTAGRPVVERLRGLAQEAEATLFMVLVAAFQVLLRRYTGERDVVVGTPVAGRNRAETEGLIGLFLNTVVLRSDLSGNATFRRLLEQVRETTLGAFAHQDLPFEMLVRELSPRRDLSRSPLFQVFFNHVVEDGTRPALPGFTMDEMPHTGKPFSKFDLTLYATEAPDHLKIELVYDAELFDRPRMTALGAAYVDLLEQIVADPYRGIDDYSLRPRPAVDLPDPRLPLSAPDPGTTPPELVPAVTARIPGQPVGNQLVPFLRRHGIDVRRAHRSFPDPGTAAGRAGGSHHGLGGGGGPG